MKEDFVKEKLLFYVLNNSEGNKIQEQEKYLKYFYGNIHESTES